MATEGIIFDIKKYALHDGPGIRTTVFFKGCSLRCWWCHNPEGQHPGIESFSIDEKAQESIGRKVTVDEVMHEIEKDIIFYDQSGGGVTFSGGEALLQPEFLQELLRRSREKGIHTTLDTCGAVATKWFRAIIDLVDVFLYDLKLVDEQDHIKYTGKSNKLILRNLYFLSNCGVHMNIRIPVVPGITDTDINVNQLLALLSTLPGIREVNLLPYHRTAGSKYLRLHKLDRLRDLESPTGGKMEQIKDRFESSGYHVKTGG